MRVFHSLGKSLKDLINAYGSNVDTWIGNFHTLTHNTLKLTIVGQVELSRSEGQVVTGIYVRL